MMIETTTEITGKDLTWFTIDSLRLRGSIYLFGALELMGLCCLIVLISGGGTSFYLWMAIFGMIFPVLLLYNMIATTKRIKKESVSFQYPIKYRITEEALGIDAHLGVSNIPWTDTFAAEEGKNAYYVYLSSLQSFIIPRRALGEQEQQWFSALLKTIRTRGKHSKAKRVAFIVIAIWISVVSLVIPVSTLCH